MSEIKVSIVVPVYNLEGYLERCLDSLISQSLPEIEIICIDDASTDRSLEILQLYRRADPRVKVLSVAKSGQGILRNRGIKMALGEYVGFVDGDDSVDPGMFEELYGAAVRNESEIAFCHATCLDASGQRVKYPYFDHERRKLRSRDPETTYSGEEIFPLLSHITVVSWNKVYKRSFLEEYNLAFGSGIIHEDIPFYYRAMLKARRVTVVRRALYNYSANRMGSTTNAVMSTSPRLLEILSETQMSISSDLENEVVAGQFFHFKTTQLLSFLNYAFHRHQLTRFTKLRFFCRVRAEVAGAKGSYLSSLSAVDKLQVWLIKRNYVKLFRARSLVEAAKYHTKDLYHFQKLLFFLIRMFYYHFRYYVYRFTEGVKLYYSKLVYKFR